MSQLAWQRKVNKTRRNFGNYKLSSQRPTQLQHHLSKSGSWFLVMCGGGEWNDVTPTLDILSHNLTSCSAERYRREQNGEYQQAGRNFGHACHEILPLPRTEGLICCTTHHLWALITRYQTLTLVYAVAPQRRWIKVQTQVARANHQHQRTSTGCTIEYRRQ